MTRAFTEIAFSPSVRAAQSRYGSRERMQRLAAGEPARAALSDEMQQRLRYADSVIIGTAGSGGWPYVQHRGGPRGFIKVLAPDTLGRGEAIDDDPALLDRVRDPDYPARVERVIRMRIEAWATNCSHIPRLSPEAEHNG